MATKPDDQTSSEPMNVDEAGPANKPVAKPELSLVDFCTQLDDYTPTIPDAVTLHYLQSSGFNTDDPRIVRLVSLSAQKFISDIINDSLQHCKLRGTQTTKKGNKDKRYVLTLEDLTPVLAEYGINVKKPLYYT